MLLRHNVKECTYRNEFVSGFNLSCGHPKSDMCSACDAGETDLGHVASYHEACATLKLTEKRSEP